MASKVCPMCHLRSSGSEWRCACGYEFGQNIDQVLVLLRDQRTNARIVLAVLLLLDVGAVAGVVYLATLGVLLVPILVLVMLVAATVRTGRTLLITRASLEQLAARATLPKAIVHRR